MKKGNVEITCRNNNCLVGFVESENGMAAKLGNFTIEDLRNLREVINEVLECECPNEPCKYHITDGRVRTCEDAGCSQCGFGPSQTSN